MIEFKKLFMELIFISGVCIYFMFFTWGALSFFQWLMEKREKSATRRKN